MVESVTRGEFRKLAKSVDKRFDAVDKRFDAVDKRFEAVDKRFDAVDKRFDELVDVIGETIANAVITIEQNLSRRLRTELGADLAGQIRASEERLRTEIRGIDDQYRDLPERVARLEVHTGIKR